MKFDVFSSLIDRKREDVVAESDHSIKEQVEIEVEAVIQPSSGDEMQEVASE